MSEESATTGEKTTPAPVAVSLRPDVLLYLLMEVLFDAGLLFIAATFPGWLQLLSNSRYPALNMAIFSVFGVGVLLTYINFFRLVREERLLFRAVRACRRTGAPGAVVAEMPRRSAVAARLQAALARPDRARDGDPEGQDALEIREAARVGWGRYITGVLTLLGLLGTFLGLMLAIEAMRDLLDLKDFQAFFQGVVGALDGMGTAFSTSLAGICGAVILGFQQLLIYQAQSAWMARTGQFISHELAPQLQDTESVGGLEVEFARLRQALGEFRVDTTGASVELRAAAQALGERTAVLAESSSAVLAVLDRQEDRWRAVEDALRDLHRLAERENRALLEMVGHQLDNLELAGQERGPGDATPEPDAPDAEAAEGAGGGADPRVAAELQRVSGLLSAIYREMALVIRSSANKLEGSQAELTRLVRRLIKRSDAQSANATHQILLLRNLLRYMGKDEEQLRQILDQVAREEAPADEEEAP